VRTDSSTALHTVVSLVAENHLRVAEMLEDGLIIEATGDWISINALVEKLVPFGIRHIVRTGPIALWKHPSDDMISLTGTVTAPMEVSATNLVSVPQPPQEGLLT
jgi:hypothetical protein